MLFCDRLYPHEKAKELTALIVRGLKEAGNEVLGSENVIFNVPEAIKAARDALAADVDTIFLIPGTWFEQPIAVAVIEEVRHLPLLLWGMPMYEENGRKESTGSLAAAAVNRSFLEETKKKFKFVIGPPDDPVTLSAANRFARASAVAQKLRRSRIGMIGYASLQMYPATFDHVTLRDQIGPEVQHVDNSTFIRMMDEVHDEDVKKKVSEIRERYFIESDVTQEELSKAARMYIAMRRLIEEQRLDALAPKCHWELSKDYGMPACVALAILGDEGIPGGCEADIHLTVTMMILQYLTGRPIYYGDTLDVRKGNSIYLSSCGTCPLSLAADPSKQGIGRHKYFFKGLRVGITIPPGRVTVTRLEGRKGTYRMHIATGHAVETELRQRYFPAAEVKLDGRVEDFMQHVLSQHYALAQADIKEELVDLCKILNVEAIVT
jgi:L-fucose isomerase-like protein